jgi:putative ABC transport system permease protein
MMRELLYALRRLRASPVFTIAATFTMAIAIGATASVFGVVDGVLLKPFPVRDVDRVMYLEETAPMPVGQIPASTADYLDVRAQDHMFSSLTASSHGYVTVTGPKEPERIVQNAVTPEYFSLLGMTPRLGRFLSGDSSNSAEVVLTYEYWQHEFGGTPSVLGHTLTLDGKLHTVVGVADKGWPGTEKLWTQLSVAGDAIDRHDRFLEVYGRLKPGVTIEAARGELGTIGDRLAQAYPETNKGVSITVVRALDTVFGDVTPALVMLLAAAVCVLLIGSANLANLFLVRCLARERDIAVRTALGATRRRLARELLVEAAVLSLVAGALGVGVALAGVELLHRLAPAGLPRLAQIGFDARLVAFCALATTATVLVFGLMPAWQASRGTPAYLLNEGGHGTGAPRHRRLQDGLTVLQIVVAFVLVTGASLLVESFDRFRRMDTGFRPEGVLAAQVTLPETKYKSFDQKLVFASRAVEMLAALPGVQSASASSGVPGTEGFLGTYTIVGDPPEPNRASIVFTNVVSQDYFTTMGYRLRRGRGLLPSDDRRSKEVVVIDEVFARRFGGRDPLGRRITLPLHDTAQVVGIVARVREQGLLAGPQPQVYVPLAQLPLPVFYVEVRSRDDPEKQIANVRHTIGTIDPTVPLSDVGTANSHLSAQMATTRFSAFLASLFAVLAVVLGAFGIYSVLAYVVTQRRRDIAIRIALGASARRVMSGVLRHALTLASVGITFGICAAWLVTRALASLFVGVHPHNPAAFAGAAGLFAAVALAAASVPAFRTTRVNPVEVLNST